VGSGAQALGSEPGQRVERKPYDLLFGQRKAPDGTKLGRPPNGGRKALRRTRVRHRDPAGLLRLRTGGPAVREAMTWLVSPAGDDTSVTFRRSPLRQ